MIAIINKYKNPIIALAFAFITIGFAAGALGNGGVKSIALIAATGLAGFPILMKAIQSLRMRVFSIELLVTIAIIGALYIHELTESAVVSFLFLFGDYLETRILTKTRASIKELVDMAPKEAEVIRDGNMTTIPVEEVVEGDTVIIRSGGAVPVDGKIVTGQASLIEAAITGESIPVLKTAGDKVFSGTIVDNGYLEMEAEKVGEETTFAKIIELVEEAQESKSSTEKFLDKFSNKYTPAVVILSILVLAFTKDLHIAITFLVIACPGALVIGAPVSNVAGIGNGARNGVLVKGGEIMEKFTKVDTVVFDKTGTLTRGKPEVTGIFTFNHYDENELLRLAATAEIISEHHLGRAIVKEAKKRNIDLAREPEDGEVIKGNGIRAKVDGHVVVIGNRKLMNIEKIKLSNEIEAYAEIREKAGNTAIFAAVDGEVVGVFSVADQIREDAAKAINEMRKSGIKKMVMLTGDNRHTAEQVANILGLDEYHAELLPKEKVEFVKKLQQEGHVVAMAGDGINDAPAIATADIGLAMGESGTDISMDTADVVLMNDKLMQFSHGYSLSKATIRNMKQNTYFAVGTVFVLLIGVLNGSLNLASGMFIHEASVLLVTLNAMRLIRFNHQKSTKVKKELLPVHV